MIQIAGLCESNPSRQRYCKQWCRHDKYVQAVTKACPCLTGERGRKMPSAEQMFLARGDVTRAKRQRREHACESERQAAINVGDKCEQECPRHFIDEYKSPFVSTQWSTIVLGW